MTDLIQYWTGEKDIIKSHREQLPIRKYKDQIIKTIRNNQITIIYGNIGSGKSTQIPQYILESGINNNKVIGITQPRPIAVINMAMRICKESKCSLGIEVGYEIRVKKQFSNCTKIKFMTDGILLNQCLLTPQLPDYSVIMIDEAHERTIDTDVLLGLLKSIAKTRKDLKLIITSATMNIEKFSRYFENAPIMSIPGNMYDVEIIYRPISTDISEGIRQIIQEIVNKRVKGGILIFLTGQEEIKECCKHLQPIRGLQVFPLYGAMEHEKQQKIFQPVAGNLRKVVVATNIAETSITIDDIRFVIDSGYVKQMDYDPKSMIFSPSTVRISKGQAEQRKGRAIRTGAGWCYRLYDLETYSKFDEDTIPEIYQKNFSSTFLKMLSKDIDPMNFHFIESPNKTILLDSSKELEDLGFLDSSKKITPLGRKLVDLSVDPKIGKVLLKSAEFNCTMNVITILSMLTEERVFIRSKDIRSNSDAIKEKFSDPDGDHFMFLNVFTKWVENNRSRSWSEENFINFNAMEEIESYQNQLIELVKSKNINLTSVTSTNKDHIKKAFISGFYKNIAKERSEGVFTNISTGEILYMHPSSCLMNKSPKLILFNKIIRTTKPFMKEMIKLDENLLVSFPSEMEQINYPWPRHQNFEKHKKYRN